MRSDMTKVLCERPRGGAGWVKGHGSRDDWRRNPELAPKRASITPRGGRTKHFSDHLGPLKKYLRRQVERPWDEVFSEICQHIRNTNTVQQHLLIHLWREIETDVVEIDGHLKRLPHNGRYGQLRRNELYVCPITRRVKAYEPCRKKCCQKPRTGWWENDKTLVRPIEGVWHIIHVAPIPQFTAAPAAYDVLLNRRLFDSSGRCILAADLTRQYNRPGVYATYVRRASSWQLAQWNLTNKRS